MSANTSEQSKEDQNDSIDVYRIIKTKRQSRAFDGEGARLFGGRWNSKGKACVYCASSESLAQLEMLVHMQKASLLMHYSLFKLTISRSHVKSLSTLPDNWQDDPAPSETAAIGDSWLENTESLALEVPSVIVPREVNYILNPLHAEFTNVVSKPIIQPLQFDPRLK